MKGLGDAQVEALFLRLWQDTRDPVAVGRAFMAIGAIRAEKGAAVMPPAAAKEQRRRARKAQAAPFMRRRFAGLIEAVASRHGLPVTFLGAARCHQGSPDALALGELCWLLKVKEGLSLESVGAVVGRHHTSVMARLDRVEERIAERPGLREELLALAGERLGERSVAA